jgi:hypothetical protein
MLKRSNIVAAEEDLQAFYRELDTQSLAAHWTQSGGGGTRAQEQGCALRVALAGLAAPGHTGR